MNNKKPVSLTPAAGEALAYLQRTFGTTGTMTINNALCQYAAYVREEERVNGKGNGSELTWVERTESGEPVRYIQPVLY